MSEVYPCTNTKCSKYDPTNKHGGMCLEWYCKSTDNMKKKCPDYTHGGVSTMINQAKKVSSSIKTTIKPYEKYIGLVALAVVIDHFLLDGKYAHKFKELAETVVEKITTGLSNLTTKLSDAWFTDTDGEDN